MVLLIIGTLEQKELGLFGAQDRYFFSWFYTFHGIPLPGGVSTMAFMFQGLFLHWVFKTKKVTRRNLGPFIVHFGALVLLGGAFYSNLTSVEGSIILSEGDMTRYFKEYRNEKLVLLPFSIELIDFEKQFHPQTLIPKSFKSVVNLTDGDLRQERIISMNDPLRYKGYTFYQASFSENSQGESSELAVVKNQGRLFPYISTIIISLGLILHLIFSAPKTKKQEL